MFKFHCTHCQQKISTEEDYSGKNVQCPTCGASFVVPSLSSSALRAEEEIKVPSAANPQTLGPKPSKQPAYQAPQMKTPAGVKTPARPRKGKGMLIGVLVAVAIILIGGAFVVLAQRAKNIDAATSSKSFVNSLGMKFVPVPIKGGKTDGQSVLFCVWETRHQDFKAFVDATGYDATKEENGKTMETHWDHYDAKWEAITTDHPVIYVSWEDAQAFCQWLTKKERDAGTITANHEYRLPTDHEWSCAVGIGNDENASDSPKDKHAKVSAYPWGGSWPPPRGVGNYDSYSSDSLGTDTYDRTSPVGSFGSNNFGIYDLGGNVWEWCEDASAPGDTQRVLRGGSWDFSSRDYVLSSYRYYLNPGIRFNFRGFRCVLVSPSHQSGVGEATAPDSRNNKDIKNKHFIISKEYGVGLGVSYKDVTNRLKGFRKTGDIEDISISTAMFGWKPGAKVVSVTFVNPESFDVNLTIPTKALSIYFEDEIVTGISIDYSFKSEYDKNVFEALVEDAVKFVHANPEIKTKEDDVGNRIKFALIKSGGVNLSVIDRLDGSRADFAPDLMIDYAK